MNGGGYEGGVLNGGGYECGALRTEWFMNERGYEEGATNGGGGVMKEELLIKEGY